MSPDTAAGRPLDTADTTAERPLDTADTSAERPLDTAGERPLDTAGERPLDTAADQEDGGPKGRRPFRGDRAPEFTLQGTGGRSYALGDHSGDAVVVVFYPADNSPVCTLQLRSYSENLNAFEDLGATVLCVSPQDVASHEEFVRLNDLKVPLLSDPDATVGRAYNILGPLGFYRRSVFVVDGAGIIRFARRSLSSLTYVPSDQLLDAVRSTRVR